MERYEDLVDNRGAGDELVWIPATGGARNLIVPARGVTAPHFGIEPDRVYGYGDEGLISMRFDGTDRRTHVKVVGKGWWPEPKRAQVARVSPDGRHALALVNEQLYVLAVPSGGKAPPTINISLSLIHI